MHCYAVSQKYLLFDWLSLQSVSNIIWKLISRDTQYFNLSAALVEGRGLAKGEIGMASLDLKRPELILSQVLCF